MHKEINLVFIPDKRAPWTIHWSNLWPPKSSQTNNKKLLDADFEKRDPEPRYLSNNWVNLIKSPQVLT